MPKEKLHMTVKMTTSISLHVKDEKEHLYGTRGEIKFWEQDVSSISIWQNYSSCSKVY